MKKYLYFILICTLCVSITACSSDDETQEEEFAWDGDWNDENNPNYNGYYNPIEGDWQRISNWKYRVIFNNKFTYSRGFYNLNAHKWGFSVIDNEYKINNTAFKGNRIVQYEFKTEDGIKYLYLRFSKSEKWHKYQHYVP